MGGECGMHGRDKTHTKFWSGNPKGRVHSKDVGVFRIGFGETRVESCGLDTSGSALRPVAVCCKHGN
jgi:hypothetical protein